MKYQKSQLYNLIEPNINSTIVTLDNDNNKKWIVIDWVTGHLNDLRLGFRDQGGLTPKPNVIKSATNATTIWLWLFQQR